MSHRPIHFCEADFGCNGTSSQHFVDRTVDTRAMSPPVVEIGKAELAFPLGFLVVFVPLVVLVVFVVAPSTELSRAIATTAENRMKAANGDMAVKVVQVLSKT